MKRVLSLTACGIACAMGLLAADSLDSCRARFDGTHLTIANAHIERQWRVAGGLLYATSFRDLDSGAEWLSAEAPQPAPYPATLIPAESREVSFTVKKGRFSPVEAESLVAELVAKGKTTLTYRFQIFPAAHGVSIQLATTADEQPAAAPKDNLPAGLEAFLQGGAHQPDRIADAVENFPLARGHLRLTQVRLFDQTDRHNELVFEDEWLAHPSDHIRLQGDLFLLEDTLTGQGLIFLKQAPLPHARPVPSPADFVYEPGRNRCLLMGEGYRTIVLAYSGGRAGRIEALQQYQRQLRVYDPKRDAMLLSNTWGDRSKDSRINAAFMSREVEAGARLGIDVIQIDDGWEHGRSVNSARGPGLWTGFWQADPNFWQPDPARFPQGLGPIVQLAASKGMKFGLWFAPDSSHDFANWQKDAQRILDLHEQSGIDYFKIDGVVAPTGAAEQNLRRFFAAILEKTRGTVTFDLDVTAGIRPGYFGLMGAGPLFVENRYTDSHRYWPHATLRNLWKLSQYVDPLRLRIEFLNNARNTNLYEGDVLAPAAYAPSYLFATTMFANPLAWFEVSNLPDRYFQELPPLIARWKRERARMFSGTLLPIGEAPDGVVWTGFASIASGRASGYLLIFREKNDSAGWKCAAPFFQRAAYHATVLAGKGTASLRDGTLAVHISEPLQFVWVKVSLAKPNAR